MPDLPDVIKKPALESLSPEEGERPGRFRAAVAAAVAGVGLAVAFYKFLRR